MLQNFRKLILVFTLLGALALVNSYAQCVQNTVITTDAGDTSLVLTCPGDGRSDLVTFKSNAGNTPYMYVITNTNNIIVDFQTLPYIDFERARSDIFRIWGLSYSGTATVERGRKLFSSTLATGCYAVSNNFIEVRREIPKGGNIKTKTGELAAAFCPSATTTNMLRLSVENTDNSKYAYIIVNENDQIVGTTQKDSLDLTGLPRGNFSVWGIAFRGEMSANLLGKNLFETYITDGCYSLSSNNIKVTIGEPNAGLVFANTDGEEIDVCAINRFLKFTNNQELIENYAYLLTNELGDIEQVFINDNTLDVNTLREGYYEVFGVVFTGNFRAKVGENINSTTFSTGCFDVSRNRLMLLKSEVGIGEITTTTGEKSLVYCSNNKISITPPNTSANVAYILTDENDSILQISGNPTITIETELPNLRLYAVAFTGELTATIGANFKESDLAIACFDRSDNFIAIQKTTPSGGRITLSGSSATTFFSCPQESNTLILTASKTGATGENYVFVAVDDTNIIRKISQDGEFIFREEESGNYNIYGIAHLLELNMKVGDSLTVAFSTECYDFSDNSLQIIWQEPNGGAIATSSNAVEAYTCPGSTANVVLKKANTTSDKYEYILTKEDGEILAYHGSNFQFDTLPEGTYLIHGIAFTGGLNNQIGEKINAVPLASGCYNLSSNTVKVLHYAPTATIVATTNFEPSVSICSASNAPAKITMTNTGDANNAYAYLLTDINNKVIAVFQSNQITLDANANSARRVWGVAYTGELLVKPNDSLNILASGCATLSINFLEIMPRQVVNGRISSFQDIDQVYVCFGDGAADFVGFYPLQATTNSYRFVITDANNIVLRIMTGNIQNFEVAGPTTSRVWGVSYTGNFTLRAGQNITTAILSTDCYALSDNFVEVIRTQLDGGMITINGSSQEVELCAGAGENQIFTLTNSSRSVARYSYIITDDNNTVLQISATPVVNVASFTQSLLKIWGIAHTEVLTIKTGDNLFNSTVSAGCYDLANNNLTIRRQLIAAGKITDSAGNTTAYVCPNDAIADIVTFSNSGFSNQKYRYAITDESDKILVLLDGSTYNFAGLEAGIYRVWGVSYTGELTVTLGDVLSNNIILSTNCYQRSENYLSVFRTSPVANQITNEDGTNSKIVYVGDQNADNVKFIFPQGVGGQPMLIITNSQNIINTIVPKDTYDFNNFPVGFYRVYGAFFTGEPQLKVGAVYNRQNISTGCFAATSNYVQLICAPAGRNGSAASGNVAGLSLIQNPVIDNIRLSINAQESLETQVSIFNSTGKLMHQETLLTVFGENQLEIATSNWANGFYMIQIQTADGVKSIACIKQSL